MKLDCLQNVDALPITIAQKALNDNQHLGENFGATTQLRRVVRYTRNVKLNKFPVNPNNTFFKIEENFAQIKRSTGTYESLVLFDWQDEENQQRIVFFGTRELFKQLCGSTMWLIDGTFRSCPKPFSQLVPFSATTL